MSSTVKKQEVSKFEAIASEWWDPLGKFRPLHATHTARMKYIKSHVKRRFSFEESQASIDVIEGLKVLDVGCGGGLISLPLARLGCRVTGIDPGKENIAVAREYSKDQGVDVRYIVSSVEDFAASSDELYDIITVMEVVEHVDDLHVFLQTVASMLRPSGILFISTINRTWKSFMKAIVGAEYVLNIFPRGTHDWRLFRPPSEIAKALGPNYKIGDLRGIQVNLEVTESYLDDDISVNYIMCVVPI